MIKNNDTHTIKINPRRTVMKILFYDTKSYDKESFEATLKKYPGIQIDYIRSDLDPRTAALADGFDAVCAFVSSNVSEATLKILHEKGVRLVLLRCAGYNNVDLEKAAAYDICVMRVPGYSPEAVAEHAMALALACNRRLYKAYNKVRENDFSLAGLMGFNFYGKIAGIIGTGASSPCGILLVGKQFKNHIILPATSGCRAIIGKPQGIIDFETKIDTGNAFHGAVFLQFHTGTGQRGVKDTQPVHFHFITCYQDFLHRTDKGFHNVRHIFDRKRTNRFDFSCQ